MAVKPSNAALTALRNNRREKQNELVGAYTAMGGSDTALLAKPTIPKLESAIDNLYQTAQSGGRSTYNDLQAMTPAYNEYRNQRTANTLSRLGQTGTARGQNAITLEMAKDGGVMSGLVNSLALNDNVRNLLTSVTGSNASSNAFKAVQDELMKGTLTDEMRAAGLTQEDIDRWNRQQNDIERQQIVSDYARNHPILATVNSFPENIAGSAEGTIEKLTNYVQGKPLESSPINAQLYRNAVGEGINSKVGNFAYGVGTSMGDMALAQLVGAGAAPALMGVEKANEVMNGAIDRGLTPNQIMAEGVGSAITTALTERIPFKEFKAGNNIGRAMVSEGLQEGSEDIADTIVDILVTTVGGNPEKSEIARQYQAYLNMGMNEEDASKATVVDYLKQVGLDAVAGAIAGGGMGGINNVSQGYNFFRGNTNANTETNVDENVKADTEQTIPTLRDSRAEEANIQARREEELAQLTNAYSQIQQRQAEEQRRAEQLAREEAARNYDPETMEFLRSTLREANGIEINPIRELLENNVRGNEQMEQQIPEVTQPEPVQQTQPVQQTPEIPSLSRRDLGSIRRQMENYKSKLSLFNLKNAKVLSSRLDKAYENVINSTGEEQTKAVDAFNQLLKGIDNVMQNEYVETGSRQLNKELFDDMKRVTDGYVIRVNDNMLDELGLTLKQLNDRTNTGTTKGANRIRFVKGNSGTAIDSVYNELYELSNHQLPAPESMAEGDMLKNLYNYVTQAKSGKNEVAQSVRWGDIPTFDSRSNIEIQADNLANEVLEKMANGDLTEDEYMDFVNFILEKGNGQNEEIQDALADIFHDVSEAWHNMPKSALPLDEDIKNIGTLEEALTTLDEELGSLPQNLNFFGRNSYGQVEANDSDRVQTGRYKTSKGYTNTAERSGNLTDEQRAAVEADGRMLYQENSEKESVAEAEKRIVDGGWEGEFKKLTERKASDFNNVDVDELFILWRHYKEQALALDARGVDSTQAWQKTVDCLTQMKAVATGAGSELQAFAKWSRNNTPEGLLTQATKIIHEVTKGAKKNPWYAQIAKETKGKTKEMDVAFIKGFLTEAAKLDGLDINSREAKHIMANLGKMVNEQIPVHLAEKVTTILMDNMLGNFKTLITRNAGGNLGYNFVEQKIRKNLSAKIDKALSERRGTRRNISENTNEGKVAYREGFKEALGQEWYDFINNIQSARSGENNLRTAVANNRQIFSNKNIFGKIGNMYNKLVRSGLSVGDRPFYEGVYSQYMTEFKKMYDSGLLGNMSEKDFKELATANAQLRALEAVYQDNTKIAEAFMEAKKMVSSLSEGIVGADILSQFTMPFVKTPANIIQRAVEYSPIGIVKNAVQTIREVRHAMDAKGIKDFDQERFATETARNIIGSVMFGAAMMLANTGGMTGAYDDDKDMAQAQREAGMQEYALHLPINGGVDVDVSSVPVLGNDLVAAAAAYDAFKNNPELTTAQRISKGLSAGIGSQFESSALQGLQRLFGASSSYGYGKRGDNKTILDQAKDTLKSGVTQFIPSLLRQFSNSTDPYQRRLTGVNPDDYYVNNMRSAIPWLRDDLEPKIGRTGEVLEQNHAKTTWGQWFNNFINPFNVTYGTEDAVRDEAMRLHESTGNDTAFQPYVSMSDITTEDHTPTAEEFTQYQQNAYGAMNQIATDVINSEYYQSLPDAEKELLLSNIYSAVKSIEKANILGSDKSNLTGAAKAYDQGGRDGLIDYLTAVGTLEQLGIANNDTNREAILQTLNNYGGDLEDLKESYDSSVSNSSMALEDLMNNQYSGLVETIGEWNSEAQIELRKELNSIINGVEFNSMTGIDKDYDGARKAYNEGGVNGLAEYIFPATVLKQYGMTNNEKNREMILNAYNEGGASAVQQIIQASQALGNDSNLTYKYEHATNYIPSLTPSQFQTTWNTINTDGNTSIKIDELIDYLNRDPGAYTAETALQYWNAFYTGTSEKIPVLDPNSGTWSAK